MLYKTEHVWEAQRIHTGNIFWKIKEGQDYLIVISLRPSKDFYFKWETSETIYKDVKMARAVV